jgi:beta-lactamase regulating signal transducer with metallopeptidase domain
MAFDRWSALQGVGLASLAWLLTYALHSTLLLGAAFVSTRRGALRAARLRNRIWKFALVAGVATTSLQVGAGLMPFGGRWSLRSSPLEGPAAELPPSVASELPLAKTRPGLPALVAPPRPVTTAPARGAHVESQWSTWAFLAWLGGGALALSGFALLVMRLVSVLRGRRQLTDGSLVALLAELRRRAGVRRRVRLSIAPRLRAPISLGILRAEICLPQRVLHELSGEEQEVLLAHELAHVVRGDPAWSWICRLFESLLFFQPLNRLARREIEDSAEFLCDAWAVRHTGLRVTLASCLTHVADWIVGERAALPAPAMARGRSRLARRVETLLDDGPVEAGKRRLARASLLSVGCGMCAALVLVVPSVSSGQSAAPRAPLPTPFEVGPVEGIPMESPPPEPEPGSLTEALTLLVRELDGELDELEVEFDSLRREVREKDLEGRLGAVLIGVERKLDLLAERRSRLQTILQGVRAPVIRGAPSAFEPIPFDPTEEVR